MTVEQRAEFDRLMALLVQASEELGAVQDSRWFGQALEKQRKIKAEVEAFISAL